MAGLVPLSTSWKSQLKRLSPPAAASSAEPEVRGDSVAAGVGCDAALAVGETVATSGGLGAGRAAGAAGAAGIGVGLALHATANKITANPPSLNAKP
ncbi:MAG: hypothetical protein IIC85_14025 [Chloroflexi bacterium]|nr:hypothetical protein [Chloroflexota bacterium]